MTPSLPSRPDADGPAMDPAVARTRGLAARRALTASQRRELSATIGTHLRNLDALVPPGRIALYRALPEEVDLSPLDEGLRASGWTLHLPRIVGEGRMEFAHWGPGERLVENRYGIGEPTGPAAEVATLDAVVMPCVAVDLTGNRVGFGAGYYDRVLAGSVARRIGVAFDAQVVEAIAARRWDVPLDMVVTESGAHLTARR